MQSYERNQTLCHPDPEAISEASTFCSYQISIGKDNGDNGSWVMHLSYASSSVLTHKGRFPYTLAHLK